MEGKREMIWNFPQFWNNSEKDLKAILMYCMQKWPGVASGGLSWERGWAVYLCITLVVGPEGAN